MGLPCIGQPSTTIEDGTISTPGLEVSVLGLHLRWHFSVDSPVREWRSVQQQSDASIFAGGPFRVTVRSRPVSADAATVEVEILRDDGGSFRIGSARAAMAIPMAGIYHAYAFPSMIGQSFQPDLKGFDVWSSPVGGIPLSFLMGLNGDNALTAGLLDQTTITRLQGQFYGGELIDETAAAEYQRLGVANNNYYLSFEQLASVEEPLQTRRHSLTLFISRQRAPWEKVFAQYALWVGEQRGFQPRAESSYAMDPMWHSWYAFGEFIDAHKIEDNARIGKELGLTNIQFDAGWNSPPPYSLETEGDYYFQTGTFPNFKELIGKIHANGQHALVHWSPFVLGAKSPAYPGMRDAVMQTRKGKEVVLCPRTAATGDYVAECTRRMIEDFQLDGLWFDFIDSVPLERCVAPHQHDFASLGEGVSAALRRSAETALRLNRNAMLVYRRPFANLGNKPFLTHAWPVDAPFDFNMNRREVLFTKPYANGVLTHACCTCWHRDESEQNVARHLASVVLAGVPAASVDLVTIPESHRKVIRSWIGFYNQHRDDLMHGEMSPLAFLPAAGALSIAGKTRNYIGLFEAAPSRIMLDEPRDEIFVVNCTGERLVTSLANLRGRFSCQVQNHLLEPVRELDLRADGELRLDVGSPAPFVVRLRRD